jgi:hypothetical protein
MEPRGDDASIEIDGSDMPLPGIWVHSQTDPFPGGHRYILRIPRKLAEPWLARRQLTWDDLGDAGWWFQCFFRDMASSSRYFQCFFSDMACSSRYSGPLQYVLNAIDSIVDMGDQVEIHGLCSPFIQPRRE